MLRPRTLPTSSDKLTLPIVSGLDKSSPFQEGAVVYDKSTGTAYVSNGSSWVNISSSLSQSSVPQSSSDRALSSDIMVNSATIFKQFIMPVVQNISTLPVPTIGAMVFNKATNSVYVVGSSGWVSSSGVASVTAANSTIVIGGTPTNPTIAGGYVAGANISIVGNTISSLVVPPPPGVLTVTAGDTTIVIGGTATNPTVSGNYTAGTGISIVGNAISNTGVVSVSAGDSTITIGGTPTNPTVSGNYTAGSGISIVGNTVSNTGVVSVTAGDSTILIGGTPTNPTVSGNYVAGTSISIVGNTISNTGVSSVTAGDTTIVIGGTSTNPTVSGNYVAGTSISIVGNTISNTGVSSITAGDSTILVGGTPTNPTVSGNYIAGNGINIALGSIINRSPSVFSTGFFDSGAPYAVFPTGASQLAVSFFFNPLVPMTNFYVVLGIDTGTPTGTIRIYDPVAALDVSTITFTGIAAVAPSSQYYSQTVFANVPVVPQPLEIYVDQGAAASSLAFFSIFIN